MSIKCLSWSFRLKVRGLALKGVLNALADHADPQGRCWPSIDRLALFAGCDAKTVRKALRDLESLGVIRRRARSGTSDLFELVFEGSTEGEAPLPELALPELAGVPLPELAGVPLPELAGDPSQSWQGNRQEPSVEPAARAARKNELAEKTFAAGIPFLTGKGVSDRRARALLGKWRRDHGDAVLQAALAQTVANGTGDPVPYVERCLRPALRQTVRADGWEGQP